MIIVMSLDTINGNVHPNANVVQMRALLTFSMFSLVFSAAKLNRVKLCSGLEATFVRIARKFDKCTNNTVNNRMISIDEGG